MNSDGSRTCCRASHGSGTSPGHSAGNRAPSPLDEPQMPDTTHMTGSRDQARYLATWQLDAIDAFTIKLRPVRHFRRAAVLKVRWRPHIRGGRYGGFYLKSVRPSHSLRWHVRHHPYHVAGWGGLNTYYGYRSFRNGW